MPRREFITQSALGGIAAVAAARGASAIGDGSRRLRVAQIGTAHAHAAEKWATLQRLRDVFEPVALLETDPAAREKRRRKPSIAMRRGQPRRCCSRDVTWMP